MAHTSEANKKRAESIDYKETSKKRKQYFKNKYGENIISNFQLEDTKEKTRRTCMEKYGTIWTTTKQSLKKQNETNMKKYGCKWGFQNEIIKNKSKKTNMEKYGCSNSMQNPDIRKKSQLKYSYDNKTFDSSWELAYYIWLKDNNIDFEYHPNVYFEYSINHRYFPDFIVNGEYIELKGDQFFKNETMIDFYNHHKNDELYDKKYKCMLQNNVKILKSKDIQIYISFSKKKYKNFPNCFKSRRINGT